MEIISCCFIVFKNLIVVIGKIKYKGINENTNSVFIEFY